MAEERGDIIEHSSVENVGTMRFPPWLTARLEWFQDLKFGLFIHWGPYCQWGCIESWPLVEEDTWARPDDLACWVERGRDLERFRADYRALNRTFNPTQFDPAVWADAAQRAGMRYVTFTTKHHDGFCMFDTETTDYRVTNADCPFHADLRANITSHVFDAFRARDFAISCYFSKSDWHVPYYWKPGIPAHTRNPNYDTAAEPEVWEKFVRFVHAQVRELMAGYGPIDALWLDGGQVRPPDQDIRMAEMAAMARELQPGLIVADRTVGGEFENILTPEQTIPDEPMGYHWESCLTMGTGWAYRPDDTYKPARQLIHMLADIVCKGGNFLLNVGPSPSGEFAADALDRLAEIGEWMAVNAAAIYGTRAVAPYREGPACFTRKGRDIYAIVLAENGEDAPPASVVLRTSRPLAGLPVRMLGRTEPLEQVPCDDGVKVVLPREELPCRHAWVLHFEAADENAST